MKKKAPDLQQGHQAVWKHLHPEPVEVELGRADELAQRRGLTAARAERWRDVGKTAEPRWRWQAMEPSRGTV
jgi:hypothetical protein